MMAEYPKRRSRYLEMADILRAEISALPPNSIVQTEVQLSSRFRVSRITTRRALDMLEQGGLISRQRGRGTIVCPPKIVRRFAPLYSFERDLEDQGIAFETKVTAYDPDCQASDPVCEQLQIAKGRRVKFLSLTRIVNQYVICHDRRYFSPDVVLQMEPNRAEDRAVSKILEELVGMKITAVDWETEIVPAVGPIAKTLGISPGTMVVQNNFTYFLENGIPVETGSVAYRIDRCKFKFGGRFSDRVLGHVDVDKVVS